MSTQPHYRQVWHWELAAAELVARKMREVETELGQLSDVVTLSLGGDLSLMCEGEASGKFGPTDIEEWGYTPL
jgi:hypothetical protein